MADVLDHKLRKENMKQADSKLIEQFNHCLKIHVAHYGVGNSRVPETGGVAVDQFLRASKNFQFFIGAIPQLPRWMYRPAILHDESLPAKDIHDFYPRFQHPAFPAEAVNMGPAPRYEVAAFPRELHQELRKQFGENSCWTGPEQAKAAHAIYTHRSGTVLAVFPNGKTTAALIGASARGGLFIMIVRSQSAGDRVCELCGNMDIRAAFWNGDMPSAFGLVVVTAELAVSDEFLHCA
ncbi:hypothetical protein TWF281_004628 [Arthrobotrys megalospora]